MKQAVLRARPRAGLVALAAACALLAACAGPERRHPQDPLEPLNRATTRFNEAADKAVIRPAAEVYSHAPLPVRTAVGNAFGNVGDLWIGVNNLLQGKPSAALSDGGRFLINSTLGIFGLFDVATELGLEKHDEDFGQTLGRWGVGEGAYLVLPLLGPSTLRDTAGLGVDFVADPVRQIDDTGMRNRATGLRVVHKRHELLGADTAAEEAALDKYEYLRSFYLQYRRNQVFDGNAPRARDDFDDDGGDDGDASPPASGAAAGAAAKQAPAAGAVPGGQGIPTPSETSKESP